MNLDPNTLIAGYCYGVFPMADEEGNIHWCAPDPRAIIPLETFHVPRRLMRTFRKGEFEIRVDSDFATVIRECARPAPGRHGTWISPELIDAYEQLHAMGFAHSVETWQDGVLVGGLYGVALRGLFAGESMFSRQPDASKIALVALVNRLRAGGFVLLDTQFLTPHLARFGAIEIPRQEYHARLVHALAVQARF